MPEDAPQGLVIAVQREDGKVSTSVDALGDVRATEIPTLLLLAYENYCRSAGIPILRG